jgi:hypothetical protein
MDIRATVRAEDADHCIAVWNRTLIQLWRFATSGPAVSGMNRIARALLAEEGGPVTSIGIVEPTSDVPGAEARAELARFSRDFASRMALAVMVAEGGGFRGAIVRSVGVALTRLAPHKVPFKFVDTVEQGAMALAPHLPEATGGPSALMRAIAELRATPRR